jgi:hypothetical protein
MIQFRCWYCGKRYALPEARFGDRITCSCERLLCVPRRNDGNCRVKTIVDRLVEAVAYGGGGALLGLGLAVLILSQWGVDLADFCASWIFVAGWTVFGFFLGLLGLERGVNWLGRMIRAREDR